MTSIEHNVRRTQWRVGLNDWLVALGWCLLVAAGLWLLTDLADKLLALQWPRWTILAGLLGLAALTSVIWAWAVRKDAMTAAAILDGAAGLKERTGSGLSCAHSDDPFARAVVLDAERANMGITPRVFIRLRWPSSLSFASAAVLVTGVVTLLPIGPLQAGERVAGVDRDESMRRVEVQRVQQKLRSLQERVDKNPALNELKTRLETLDDLPPEKLPQTPQSIRREAVKKIDNLADAVKEEQAEREQTMKAIKRMFRGLKATQPPQNPDEKLSQALAKGDFRAAREALDEMREQLARMAEQEDPQRKKEMQEQLDKLASKLEQVARQDERKQELQKELQEAGVDEQTARRTLENLTKEDLQQVREQMQKDGASKQQISDMMKKLAANKAAAQQGSDLADAMQKAAQAMQGSSAADAAQQLQQAADQLNSMEMLDQQLGEMESTLQDLQDMKDELAQGDPGNCSSCNGRGCSRCGGSNPGDGRGGTGMKPGQGRGGRNAEEVTRIGFKKERTPVVTTEGSIIAKMFVDGEQVRGEVASQAVELMTAAERDATDAINKNKVPNQYRGPIKKYFSGMLRDLQNAAADGGDGAGSTEAGD